MRCVKNFTMIYHGDLPGLQNLMLVKVLHIDLLSIYEKSAQWLTDSVLGCIASQRSRFETFPKQYTKLLVVLVKYPDWK